MADEPKLTLVERLRAIATAYKITGNKASDEYSACSEAAEEIERLRLSVRSQKRKKYHAVSARDEHANGLEYWRERALAAETSLAAAVAYADAVAMVEGMPKGKQCKQLTAGEFPNMKVFDVAAARASLSEHEGTK